LTKQNPPDILVKMITAKIIKDSINSATDDRLTTFVIKYPRFVHAEFMTHRVFSKNSASSRAIPSKKMIQMIVDDPALPVFWGKNQAGMQAHEEIEQIEQCKLEWLDARDECILRVEELLETFNLHKQIASRILEPWFNITVIVSGTEWENFFALRAHKDAQPEIRELAEQMLACYNSSIPDIKVTKKDKLENLNWHIPFEENMPEGISKEDQLKIAIARCARVSYVTFDGKIDPAKDLELYERLVGSAPLHASPTEHVAYPIFSSEFVGNFSGWVQYRKTLKFENATDSRVIKRRVINGIVI
jgi:thymidylate synthase ThyX